MEKIILELNNLLIAETFNKEQFESLIKKLKEKFNLKLELQDFEFYNEIRLTNAQIEKREAIEAQHYDWAATQRKLEVDC